MALTPLPKGHRIWTKQYHQHSPWSKHPLDHIPSNISVAVQDISVTVQARQLRDIVWMCILGDEINCAGHDSLGWGDCLVVGAPVGSVQFLGLEGGAPDVLIQNISTAGGLGVARLPSGSVGFGGARGAGDENPMRTHPEIVPPRAGWRGGPAASTSR